MKKIIEEYIARHRRSSELYAEAQGSFPSGITHDSRHVQPFPLFMSRGRGSRKWDVDGNEYICYVMGHGALILGHSHPEIVAAVEAQVRNGTHLGANTEQELRWARAVKRLMPSVEKIRFHSSGTEATLMAIRLARACTGKTRIVLFQDHFHGWHDCVVPESGKWTSAGIPPATFQSSIRLPAGDIGTVEATLKKHGDVAGLILEPTGASMGCHPLHPEFVGELRELTERHGVVLIFDEVVTGFRASPGGAQETLGVKPDLTALAKILAGGLPGGAVGGKAEIMDMIAFHDDPSWDKGRRVSHPGTFNANPLSASAGSRCLELIAETPVNSQADAAAQRLKAGLNLRLQKSGVAGIAYGYASFVWVLIGVEAASGAIHPAERGAAHSAERDGGGEGSPFFPFSSETIKAALTSATAQVFKRAMLNEGVDLMGAAQFIVSSAHTDRDIDDTLEAFDRAISKMKAEVALP